MPWWSVQLYVSMPFVLISVAYVNRFIPTDIRLYVYSGEMITGSVLFSFMLYCNLYESCSVSLASDFILVF